MRQSFIIFSFFISFASFGQTPHLKGIINLDIPKGLITCQFTFSNTSPKGSYTILLNSGFNLKYFQQGDKLLDNTIKDNSGKKEYELYSRAEDKEALKSVEGVTIFYTEAFPTNTNDSVTGDDMGSQSPVRQRQVLLYTIKSVFKQIPA